MPGVSPLIKSIERPGWVNHIQSVHNHEWTDNDISLGQIGKVSHWHVTIASQATHTPASSIMDIPVPTIYMILAIQ